MAIITRRTYRCSPKVTKDTVYVCERKEKKREKDQKGLSIRVRVNLSYSKKEPQKVCAGLSLSGFYLREI